MWELTQLRIQDLVKGGPALICPKKCVIWASEYNLGPQKWGVRGARAPPPWIRYWLTSATHISSSLYLNRLALENVLCQATVTTINCTDGTISWIKILSSSFPVSTCTICSNGSRIWPGGPCSGPPEKCVIWASEYI